MQLDEMLADDRPIILEYGRKGFPGYGMSLFGQRFYEYMVPQLNQIRDEPAREWLTHWLCDVFRRDNGKFSVERFMRAVWAKKSYSAYPVFQQRHFYYLAHWVKEIEDPAIHDFVRGWLAEVAGRTNPAFKSEVWNRYCGEAAKPPEAAKPAPKPPQARPEPAEDPVDEAAEPVEVDEGPAYGRRGHGGFNQKFFTKGQYQFIAWCLGDINDDVVQAHLIGWFGKIFKLDNADFKPEAFAAMAEQQSGSQYRPNEPRFQQRHFYFLAHEVAEITDPHERAFICDWLARNVGRTNANFNVTRWEEYCNLDAKSSERRYVAHNRAVARGDKDIPETPWEEQQRLAREAATPLTAEQFHQAATCYDEHQGKLAGHDLVYYRKQDGEYEVFDKTTGRYCWSVNTPNAWADRAALAAD